MQNEVEAFQAFLDRKGMRLTAERQAILAEVFAEHEHFDVEGLIMRLRRKGSRASRASVYRTLALLVESGLVQEVFFEDGHMHYEHIYGHEHHCHLRCVGCRKIIEFRHPAVEATEREIAAAHGFAVSGHRLEIFGLCPECLANQR